MSTFVILGFIVGVIASVVVLFIITAIIVIFIFIISLEVLLGGSSGDGRKFRLDNGDVVTEHQGFLGEKTYTGVSGKTYSTNDGGNTFTEN